MDYKRSMVMIDMLINDGWDKFVWNGNVVLRCC